MLAKTCVGHVWRARDASGRVLGEHRVSGSEARPLWEVAECRGRRGAVESGRHGVHVTSSFMGGAFSLEMGTLSRSDAGRGRSITFVIKATLAHLWSPRSETIKWTREAPCPVCEGRGAPAHHVAPCPVCGGSGLEHEHATVRGRSRWANGTAAEGGEEGPGTVTFAQRADARCSLCDGYGERPDPKHVCRACKVRMRSGGAVPARPCSHHGLLAARSLHTTPIDTAPCALDAGHANGAPCEVGSG